MGERSKKAKMPNRKKTWHRKTLRTSSPRRDSYRYLNPHVMRMDRIRANET